MLIFIQMDGFEETFLKRAKNLFVHLSKLLLNALSCNGKKCSYKVIMSVFEHFNVYEDIPSNYFLSQVKKKKKLWRSVKCGYMAMELRTF